MELLPLDDPRWLELDHRNWRDGQKSEWAPSAPFVPHELAELAKNPADHERFDELWPWLCSEGTTYSAAYAAVPYMVLLAKQVPPAQRLPYFVVIGLIEADSRPEVGGSLAMKDYLVAGYQKALSETLYLIQETLEEPLDVSDTRYLLAAIAALKGHRKLARVLQNLDCISTKCPKCSEMVFYEAIE